MNGESGSQLTRGAGNLTSKQMNPEGLNGFVWKIMVSMVFSFQVEAGSWSGEMNPLTVEEQQPLGQWEVQIQTNTPLTFIKVGNLYTQYCHILIIIQPTFSVPIWTGHPFLWKKLHSEKQVHASPRGFATSAFPWHISGVFLLYYVLSSFL